MGKRMLFVFLIALLAVCIVGCSMIQKKTGEEKKVDYTVVKKEELPPEVKKVIEIKKQEEFQMTYQEEDMLYLLQGYGIQSSGGYSIRVENVSENDTELHVKTKLIGPKGKDGGTEGISCPYLVIKVENRHKKVVFD